LPLRPSPAQRYGPPALAIGALLLAVAGLVSAGARAAGGEWVYPLDDTYIHMELAWRLAQDGTWGVNPGDPASASSSPLWAVLLALGMVVSGHRAWLPLALATAAAIAALVVADRQLRPQHSGTVRLLGLVALGALAPLPAMAALGMEHALQIALTLAVGGAALQDLQQDRAPREPPGIALGLLGALVSTRFEGLFLGAAWASLAALQGRRGSAIRVLTAGALPVAAFAVFSGLQGLPLLPAGLLMKSKPLDGALLQNLRGNLTEGAVLLMPAGLVWALDAARGGPVGGTARARLLGATTALQLLFGGIGWYYRYEAWLVAWATVLSIQAAHDCWGRPPRGRDWRARLLLAGLGLAALAPTALRAYQAHAYLPSRVLYIADVKVRLARALVATDPRAVPALHDIGAMAWETDLRLFDTAGLATDAVLRLSRDRRFTGQSIGALSRSAGATVGLGAWSWMEHDRPEGWRPVARLTWALDAHRRSEPLLAYAIAEGAEDVARNWMIEASAAMEGRGRVEVLDGAEWRPLQ
jgi:hypothetical protein